MASRVWSGTPGLVNTGAMSTRSLRGSVSLGPHGIDVTAEALGAQFTAQVDRGEFTLTFPIAPSALGDERLRSPFPLDQTTQPRSPLGWGMAAFSNAQNVYTRYTVRTAAFEAEISITERKTVRYLGYDFAEWYNRVAQWIEVWTLQILWYSSTRPIPTPGRIVEFIPETSKVASYSWDELPRIGPRARLYKSPTPVPASDQMLTGAFRRASENETPPIEWLTFMNALRIEDTRLAAIEAATAAEVALSQAAENKLSNLPADGAAWVIRRTNGIAALAQMLKALDGNSEATKLAERIALPRNKAVHRGMLPTHEEVSQSIVAAYQMLKTYSTLPGWE